MLLVARHGERFTCPAMRSADTIVLASIDLLARLAVPGALLAMARGYGNAALVAASLVVVLSLARGLLTGRAIEHAFHRTWRKLVDAAARYSVAALHARPKEKAVAALVSAAHETAHFEGTVTPRILSNIAGLVIVGAVSAWRFGPLALGLALLALALLGSVAALMQRRIRRARTESWARYATVARDMEALLDAAAELRAHRTQEAFVRELLGGERSMARAERQATSYGAVVSLLPAGLALLVVAAPLRNQLAWLVAAVSASGVAEAGVLAATALALSVALVQASEEAVRAIPWRRSVQEFVQGAGAGARAKAEERGLASDASDGPGRERLREIQIDFDAVSIAYPGCSEATPSAVSHRWRAGTGLAVTGDNGAGKSSLALALLGLVEPTSGEIRFGKRQPGGMGSRVRAESVAYVPQQAFVAPGASIGWHLKLLGGEAATAEAMEAALRRVGLYPMLERRAAQLGSGPLGILAGELSGGEIRRVQLARVFIGDPDLVVLDEPEAGLDSAGRAELRDLLATLSQERRVMLIAHDPSVIPAEFERVVCVRGPVAASSDQRLDGPVDRGATPLRAC